MKVQLSQTKLFLKPKHPNKFVPMTCFYQQNAANNKNDWNSVKACVKANNYVHFCKHFKIFLTWCTAPKFYCSCFMNFPLPQYHFTYECIKKSYDKNPFPHQACLIGQQFIEAEWLCLFYSRLMWNNIILYLKLYLKSQVLSQTNLQNELINFS